MGVAAAKVPSQEIPWAPSRWMGLSMRELLLVFIQCSPSSRIAGPSPATRALPLVPIVYIMKTRKQPWPDHAPRRSWLLERLLEDHCAKIFPLVHRGCQQSRRFTDTLIWCGEFGWRNTGRLRSLCRSRESTCRRSETLVQRAVPAIGQDEREAPSR